MESTSTNLVTVGGIQVTPFPSMAAAVAHIIQADGSVLPGFGIAINPEKVMLAHADDDLKALINDASLRFADGTGVVRTMSQKGAPTVRIPGCELWEALMQQAATQQLPVVIIGAKPEVNAACAEKLKAQGTPVAAAIDGYFKDEQQLHDALLQHRPKIVTVAMGSPRQEKLIQRLREVYPDAFYLGVGGTYDVFTGFGKRAPKLFCDLHLEWFYRLCSQPSRLGRQLNLVRYLGLHLRRQL